MNQVYATLGLCKKAGALVSGEDAVNGAIRNKTAELVIIAHDASGNTKKRFADHCAYYQVKLVEFGLSSEIGHALGKKNRVSLAVTDRGFAEMIAQKIGTPGNVRGGDEN